MPTFQKESRHKRSIIGSIISGFISLAYKAISSILHNKHQKALKKAVTVMERKADIQQNKMLCMVFWGAFYVFSICKVSLLWLVNSFLI